MSAVITTVYAIVGMLIVCFGYNIWYFELKLPNGSTAQILDVMDYLSNNIFMPLVAILSCILIGWVVKPKSTVYSHGEGCSTFTSCTAASPVVWSGCCAVCDEFIQIE